MTNNPGQLSRASFKPGDFVHESGIYEVVHGAEHRSAQRGVMVRGLVFPACRQCGDEVRYVLQRPALYILDDEDFAPQR